MLLLMFLYFTVRYSLLNVLDLKAAGAMVEVILPEGKPVWLDQIRDRFLHPTSDSFAAYANTILGEDDGDELDDTTDPIREEVIVLSSESSDRSREGLIPRSPHASPAQGSTNEPVNELVGDGADPPVETVERLETRKKKKLDKSERKEKKVKESVTEPPCTGEKRTERDPDEDETLTEIMRKKKVLEDKKKELDEQAAAALAAKKSKLQKETPPAPSESEIDLGVFSAKHGNLLEKIYDASGSQGAKSGKGTRKIDISQITPPTSPPSRTFDLSPPPVDRGKRKEDDANVEQVGEGGGDAGAGAGAAGAGATGGGDDVVEESSEATPHHTVYTKVVRGSGQGGASGTHHSPQYEHVQGGSWDTHNPACADLPHAPRWNLTQGSRMSELANCRELFSLSLPPAERLFQKRRDQLDLLDDHIHAGVNFFATSQEIAREWQLMGEDILEFENVKKAFAEEREKFNAEKKGLAWRVADAQAKGLGSCL
ncbi:hypothetical protein HanRHA438_Chr11g0517431 [Helianthus annuus]|nr:hypothetical protein HanHA89_Chr11g0438231 [Helianthus annuus]KAJ0686540.1 hypothetical protein HanLR1_Chr11g0415921 [Helianthus annuus]KAJ0799281.1 hypothetical protein HanLR1_Chr00c2093g0834271 [Helianthus annuus]KAJ0871876.1 hypothetical protein HanRHA438_Chr11g0517431 [Helianthus annuus]